MKGKPYTCLIGSLMYVTIATCMDIVFAISILTQFMANPIVVHWEATKHVLWYLIDTKSLALTFGCNCSGFIAYSNSTWESQAHCHSILDVVYLFNSTAINWLSCNQLIIALSSVEAKYICVFSVTHEIY
jgi:hypothetical protein